MLADRPDEEPKKAELEVDLSTVDLPLHLQMAVVKFNMQVDHMSIEQLRELCKTQFKSHLQYEQVTQMMLLSSWGL